MTGRGERPEEPAMDPEALRSADEAFLTSSTREVQAISRVDGSPLPSAPGPITTRLTDAFRELVAGDLDP